MVLNLKTKIENILINSGLESNPSCVGIPSKQTWGYLIDQVFSNLCSRNHDLDTKWEP